jgi:hypothetical protein
MYDQGIIYFFLWKSHQLITGFFAHHRTVSADNPLMRELNPYQQRCLPGL